MSGSELRYTPSVASLLCPASHWGVLPSEGTEAHSVLLLKTLFAPPVSGGQRKRETESGRSFYERRKAGRENEMPRNAKTRIWRVRFCPPEHMNMLSGRTRTSHPGGQGRVNREDKSESPRRTRASHPGGQKSVLPDDKIGVP